MRWRHCVTFLRFLMILTVSRAFLLPGKLRWSSVAKTVAPSRTNPKTGHFVGARVFSHATQQKGPKSLQFGSNEKLIDTYNTAVKWLDGEGLDDAEDSARHLISHATNIGTRFSDFHNNNHRNMSASELSSFAEMCQQRANRMPVQYIIGNWDFYGLTFQCKPPILIPRPETEELVEKILNTKLLQFIDQPKILDVGAGTGAVGIALLSQLPHAQCCSIDINMNAVQLARSNAKPILDPAHGNRYSSYHVDFVSFVKNVLSRGASRTQDVISVPLSDCSGDASTDTVPYNTIPQFDLIVSNPPYIPSADITHLQPEIRQYEDSVALDGGADGLDIVRDLIFLAPLLMSPLGTRELWLEVSEAHPKMVEDWLSSSYDADKQAYFEKWVSGGGPTLTNWDVKPTAISGIVDLVGNPRFIRIKY